MGKKLVIKGANFSANGIFDMQYVMDSIPSENLTYSSATTFATRAWTNFTIGGTSCYYPTIYGAKVKCMPNKFVKLFAVKSDGSYRFLQRFDIPSSVTAGSWQTLILDTPETMAAGEYLAIASDGIYYKENQSGTGIQMTVTDGTGTATPNTTNANIFAFHRIYDYVQV